MPHANPTDLRGKTHLDVIMETIEICVILDRVKGDCTMHLSLLEGPRESLGAAAVVVKDTLHLFGRDTILVDIFM